MTLFLISIVGIGVWAAIPLAWTLPARWLGKEDAIGGIGVVAALAQFGPFFSPMVIGFTVSPTGSIVTGLYVHAAALIIAGLLMLFLVPGKAVKVGTEEGAG
jgi:MFS family permease